MSHGKPIRKGFVAKLKILTAIYDYAEEKQRPITYREICKKTSIKSTATVALHVNQLKLEGFIESHGPREPRSLILTEQGKQAVLRQSLV